MKVLLLVLCVAQLVVLGIAANNELAQCVHDDIRMYTTAHASGHNPRSGVFQYCDKGTWRYPCHTRVIKPDGNNFHSSNVICRQLGYAGTDTANRYECVTLPGITPNYGTFVIDIVCNGLEKSVKDCNKTVMDKFRCYDQYRDDQLCSSPKVALREVMCSPANCSNGEIRLVNGTTNREGRVEVCLDGRWGNIDTVSSEDICQQLGFPRKDSRALIDHFGKGTGPVYSCIVDTRNTFNCNYACNESCDHSMDLGVVCQSYQQIAYQIISETINETRQECTEPPPLTTPTITTTQSISEIATPTEIQTKSCDNCNKQCNKQGTETILTEAAISGSGQGCDTTTALGAVVGVLVALLVPIVIGWICTCVFLRRKPNVSQEYILDNTEHETTSREVENVIYESASETNLLDVPLHDITHTSTEASTTPGTSLPRLQDNPIYEGADEPQNETNHNQRSKHGRDDTSREILLEEREEPIRRVEIGREIEMDDRHRVVYSTVSILKTN